MKDERGIGMRGPGETEIETDRRIVRDKISLLKLSNIDKQMSVQEKQRKFGSCGIGRLHKRW